jgi:alpha-tubulin suppressor-like RCC1 family protein
VSRVTPRVVARIVLGLLPGPLLLAGCQLVLGLGGETNQREAGTDGAADVRGGDVDEHPGVAIVVSSSFSASDWCAVTAGGDVECWGNNESGELGDGTTNGSTTPVKVKGIEQAAAFVSVGVGSACALTTNGSVYCWGYGVDGELGNGTEPQLSERAVPVSGLDGQVTALSTANGVSCAVKAGALYCWGASVVGLLGTGQSENATTPIRVPPLESGVTAVSVGQAVACAVKDGDVLCWGMFATHGELGNGTTKPSATPVRVKGLPSRATAVSAGLDFACALTDTGGVLCWGNGATGALGNGLMAISPVAVQVEGLRSGVVALSAGVSTVGAIKADGSVVSWGFGADGELGNGSIESDSSTPGGPGGFSLVPVSVIGLKSPAVSLSEGDAPCVATRAGTVACWGLIAENALTPVPVTAVDEVIAITAGGDLSTGVFACAVSKKGFASCWGGNLDGQLGTGTTSRGSNLPTDNAVLVASTTGVSASNGGNFGCGVGSGIAYCWGANASGQLGNGTTKTGPTPTAVQGLAGNVLSVAAGALSACAITAGGADAGVGGALYCWGDNTLGQLGNDSTAASLVPVPVQGLSSGVLAVSLAIYSACALLADGSVDCWGDNFSGQLGDGTTNTSLVPKKVVGVTGATAISTGWFASCAVTGGSIKCWGGNSYGELGNDSTTDSLVPVSVSDIFGTATKVSVGVTSTCAVVSGAALCWGNGPIGNDSASELFFTTPAAVTGLGHGVTAVAVGEGFACANVSGGVRCWGFNTDGQLGNGGAVDEFVPTPVVGFP